MLLNVICFSITFSQQNQNSEIAQYFDDGGIAEKSNFIKMNFASLVAGDLSLSYERKFGKKIGLELSSGFIMPFYIWEFGMLGFESNESSLISPIGGYSYNLQMKYYYFLENTKSDGAFIGFQYRKRNYNQKTYNFDFNDYYINFGVQYFIATRTLFTYELGLGFRYSNTFRYDDYEEEYVDIVLPMALKLSYLF